MAADQPPQSRRHVQMRLPRRQQILHCLSRRWLFQHGQRIDHSPLVVIEPPVDLRCKPLHHQRVVQEQSLVFQQMIQAQRPLGLVQDKGQQFQGARHAPCQPCSLLQIALGGVAQSQLTIWIKIAQHLARLVQRQPFIQDHAWGAPPSLGRHVRPLSAGDHQADAALAVQAAIHKAGQIRVGQSSLGVQQIFQVVQQDDVALLFPQSRQHGIYLGR